MGDQQRSATSDTPVKEAALRLPCYAGRFSATAGKIEVPDQSTRAARGGATRGAEGHARRNSQIPMIVEVIEVTFVVSPDLRWTVNGN
jgi:hypothetical protein